MGSSRPGGQAHRLLDGSCHASQRIAAYPVPTWYPTDAGWRAAQSLPPLPDHDPVPPWPARADPLHVRVASSETVAAHPEAAREPRLLRPAKRHITVPLHGCSTGGGPTPRPCAGSLRGVTVLPEPGTSSPRAPRWRRRAPVVAHSPEAIRPGPYDATPNSCCDQNAAPVPPAHSRSAAPVPPEASLPREPSRGRPNASTGQGAEPPLRSATRPPPRPCLGPVAGARRSADSRRSPDIYQAARQQPPRSASADRWPPTTPATAVAVPADAREGAPDDAQVDGIPGASHASPRQLHSAPDSIWDCAAAWGSVAGYSLESIRYGFNWDCVTRNSSAPITPIKSAPCTPNSDCAMSQGSRFKGDGKRSGSGGRSPAIRA